MPEQIESKEKALSSILSVVAKKSGRGVLYTSAILGLAALFPGLELPGALGAIAGGVGVEALGTILESVTRGERLTDEEIVQQVEDAVAQSGVESLLTRNEFWHAFAHLREGQHSLRTQNEALFSILQRTESFLTEDSKIYSAIPKPPKPYFPHPFPLQNNFVGREKDKRILSNWLSSHEKSLAAVVAVGGMGKSSLAWSWLQEEVLTSQNRSVLWWNFYRESETRFEKFVDEAIYYLSNGKVIPEILGTAFNKTKKLVQLITERQCLIVLDGFERELRAYAGIVESYSTSFKPIDEHFRDCTEINASRFLRWLVSSSSKGKVLITSRLLPAELEGDDHKILPGCRLLKLQGLSDEESVLFLQRQGIHGLKGELKHIASLCHYHPLNLRLLSGYILSDVEYPGDANVIIDYPWDPNAEQVRRQKEILEIVFSTLTTEKQRVASYLATTRIPFEFESISTICNYLGLGKKTIRSNITALLDRNLLSRVLPQNLYEFHPIIRAFLLEKLANEEHAHHLWSRIYAAKLSEILKDSEQKLVWKTLDEQAQALRDEFLQAQIEAGSIDEESATMLLELFNNKGIGIETTHPQIEIEEELKSLVELIHHLLGSGEIETASELYDTHFDVHSYDTYLRLNVLTELVMASPNPRLMNQLAIAHIDRGHPSSAKQLFELCLQPLLEVRDDVQPKRYSLKLEGQELYTAVLLGNLADAEFNLGMLASARERLDAQIQICSKFTFPDESTRDLYKRFRAVKRAGLAPFLENPGLERMEEFEARLGTALYQISRLYICIGEIEKAIKYAYDATMIKDARGDWGGCHIATMYLSLGLAAKGQLHSAMEIAEFSVKCAEKSKVSRNIARANIARGRIYLLGGTLEEAENSFKTALHLCKGQFIDVECDVLIALAELHHAKAEDNESYYQISEALSIADRCSYRLKQADCHLLLAKLSQARENRDHVETHARLANEFAICDGSPNWYKSVVEQSALFLGSYFSLH